MDATESDHRVFNLGSLLRETERIANVIGYILNLRHLVVVGEDHGIARLREFANLGVKLGDRDAIWSRLGRHRQVE